MAKKEWASYEEASAFAKKEGITTLTQWQARAKQGLPENIPADPRGVYKEEFKNGGWGRFLGTGAIAPKNRQFVSYEEASAFAKKEGITTGPHWNARAKQGLPENIPADPRGVYKEDFKNGGWGRFLGTGAIAPKNRQFVSYEEAATFAQNEGITTLTQWQARAKQGLPDNIPSDPYKIYKKEFLSGGWGRFLGTRIVATFKRKYASYEEAAAFAQNEGIASQSQWLARVKKGLPDNIPADLWGAYKEEFKNGGLGRFLGLKNRPGESKIERSLRYALEQAFGEPVPFSSNPKVRGFSKIWRVDVFLSGPRLVVEYDGSHFHHGREHNDTRKTQDLLSAGHHVVRIRGATSRYSLKALREDWDMVLDEKQAHITQIALVFDHLIHLAVQRLLPLTPDTISRLEKWKKNELPKVNFRAVLEGYDGFVSYNEAATFAQNEGITTLTQWQARAKQGLPDNIPSDPYKIYKKEFLNGGWGRFLGTGTIANFKRKFSSYEEASVFAKKEGIFSQKQWRKRAKKGLPNNMPSNPDKAYKKEFENGGWGRFLGTGKIAPRNRKFVSYKEAATFSQKEGITSQLQWQALAKKGLPENIPSNPQQVYKEEFENGGWGRFLATGTIANHKRTFVSYEEASVFAQKEGITTYAQWNARTKQGLPENIPADPRDAYKEEFKNGGVKRFLATGPFAKQPATETLPTAPQLIPETPSLSEWRAQRKAAPTAPQQPPVVPKRPKP